MKSHLYPPVQQLTGQDLEGGAVLAGETGQTAEQTARTGVPDHVTWMEHVQRLKVVVDGVAHDHFALEYSEDLRERRQAQEDKYLALLSNLFTLLMFI